MKGELRMTVLKNKQTVVVRDNQQIVWYIPTLAFLVRVYYMNQYRTLFVCIVIVKVVSEIH